MKLSKSIKIFIFILIPCFANAQTTIESNKLHKQTDLPYQDKENNEMGSMSKVDELVFLAKSKLGNVYEPTKAGPDNFDCSGFVYYLFTTIGVSIPRTSIGQSEIGKKLTREELKKGDMLFFDTYQRNHINHSGVYLGDGKFIHSSSGKAYGVIISDLDKGFYLDKFRWGIRKIENEVK
ncbi:MAG: C40 family peptidase [Nitrososphaeraceae archaeon]